MNLFVQEKVTLNELPYDILKNVVGYSENILRRNPNVHKHAKIIANKGMLELSELKVYLNDTQLLTDLICCLPLIAYTDNHKNSAQVSVLDIIQSCRNDYASVNFESLPYQLTKLLKEGKKNIDNADTIKSMNQDLKDKMYEIAQLHFLKAPVWALFTRLANFMCEYLQTNVDSSSVSISYAIYHSNELAFVDTERPDIIFFNLLCSVEHLVAKIALSTQHSDLEQGLVLFREAYQELISTLVHERTHLRDNQINMKLAKQGKVSCQETHNERFKNDMSKRHFAS